MLVCVQTSFLSEGLGSCHATVLFFWMGLSAQLFLLIKEIRNTTVHSDTEQDKHEGKTHTYVWVCTYVCACFFSGYLTCTQRERHFFEIMLKLHL